MVTWAQGATDPVHSVGLAWVQYGSSGPGCPVSLGDPGRFLQHLCMVGDHLYGRNTSGVGAPVQKIGYPGFALEATLFTTTSTSSVNGVAVYPDGTALVAETIPSGVTSHGNTGPLSAMYRIDPGGTITTIATYATANRPMVYSAADGRVYVDMGTTLAWVNPTTGVFTTVETVAGSDLASTTDGAIWLVVSNTAVNRYDPVTDTVINVTGLASFVSTLIPVGTSVWVPQLLGTGYQINADGSVTTNTCMTGFAAMSEACFDLLDPSRSVCEDSSPRELFVIE